MLNSVETEYNRACKRRSSWWEVINRKEKVSWILGSQWRKNGERVVWGIREEEGGDARCTGNFEIIAVGN